jgi:hypothetical protein
VDGNTVKLVTMTEEEIDNIVRKAVEIGANTAMKKLDEERKKENARKKNRRLHNTELLLRNYTLIKLSVENSIYDIKQLEEEQSVNEVLSYMMESRGNDEIVMKSIMNSKMRSSILLEHIDNMLEVYQIVCERSNKKYDMRQYNTLIDRFITTPALSVKEISRKNNVSKELVYADLKTAKEKIAILIFGIDGLGK